MVAPLPKIRKSLPTYVQREFRGVNKLDPLTIGDAFASDMSNVSTFDYPVLKTRPGFSLVGSALASRILGLAAWKDTELNAVANGQWYKYSGGAWSAVSGGGSLSTSANWSFTNFKGGFADINLVGSNGAVVKRYDGSTVQDLTGAPSGLNYIETFGDRLWGAVANTLHFSEFRVGTNWTTTNGDDADPGFITVETNDGDTITGIRTGTNRMIVFKANSMHNLFGSYAEAFTLKRVLGDVGALNNQAIVALGGLVYFVHRTGAYVYDGGTQPDKRFSAPVQKYFDRINLAASSKVCAGTDGRYLYFGLPLDSATDPNTILVYSPEFDSWTVWNGYAPLNLAKLNRDIYIGGVEGQVRKVGGTTDNGAAISGYWTTKVYGADSYSQRITWRRAWIIADVPSGSILSVYISKNPDGISDFNLVQNVPVNNGLGNTRIIIPTSTLGVANFAVVKFVFSGPVTIKEWSRDEEALPIT